jgi:hypothetical protein
MIVLFITKERNFELFIHEIKIGIKSYFKFSF